MCERTRRVVIGSDSSAEFPVRFGVLKGSLFGTVFVHAVHRSTADPQEEALHLISQVC